MFLKLFVIAIFLLIVYEMLGHLVKRVFHISFGFMNLIIGYSLSVFVFYFVTILFINHHESITLFKSWLFPIYTILMVILLLFSVKKRHIAFNYLVIAICLGYIAVFFTYAFILPGESTYYLSQIHQSLSISSLNLSPFQVYTLYLADLFHVNSTVFIVNVMTFIHLFIILYTIYEVFAILVPKYKYLAFILYLGLFTFVNTTVNTVYFPMNAYHFIYHPYLGVTIYLFALIPCQFALFYHLDKSRLILFLLINVSALIFTPSSLLLQFVMNGAFIITLLFLEKKSTKQISALILVTLFPLLFYFFFYMKDFLIIYTIFLIILIGGIYFIGEKKIDSTHLHRKTLILILFIFLLGLFSYLYSYYRISMSDDNIQPILYNKANWFYPILFFNILTIYALFKLNHATIYLKRLLFYFPLIILIALVNPVTLYMAYTHQLPMSYLFFLLPVSFSIIVVFFTRTHLIEKIIILILALIVSQSIFEPLNPVVKTKQNVYYRINQDILDVSNALNQQHKPLTLLVSKSLVNEINVNTNQARLLINYKNLQNTDQIDENLLFLYFTINDQIPFDPVFFAQSMKDYHITTIILKADLLVNQNIASFSQSQKQIHNFIIYNF